MKRRIGLWALLAAILVAIPTLAYRSCYQPLPAGITADELVLEKSKRKLTLLRDGVILKRYSVALGRVPIGPKRFEGDRRTPEGYYIIDRRLRDSAFHLALHVSYPSARDRAQAAVLGRPPGSDIMIHGIRNGFGFLGPLHRTLDWTQGCIAVTNAEIEEIWRAVPNGTVIEIRP